MSTSQTLAEQLAATAHELRTPLAMVQLAVDTALERGTDLTPHELDQVLQVIERNTRSASMAVARLEVAVESRPSVPSHPS